MLRFTKILVFFLLPLLTIGGCCKVKTTYYPEGNIESEVRYCRQKTHGIAKWYFRNGKVKLEISYKKGLLHGKMIRFYYFYEDGSVQIKGAYKEDQYNGLWQYFDSEGFLVGEGDFKMGEGILKRYNNIGKLVQTREYRQSKAVGRSVYYNEKGEIIENVTATSE